MNESGHLRKGAQKARPAKVHVPLFLNEWMYEWMNRIIRPNLNQSIFNESNESNQIDWLDWLLKDRDKHQIVERVKPASRQDLENYEPAGDARSSLNEESWYRQDEHLPWYRTRGRIQTASRLHPGEASIECFLHRDLQSNSLLVIYIFHYNNNNNNNLISSNFLAFFQIK